MTNVEQHFKRAAERFDSSPISVQLGELAQKLIPELVLDSQQHWLDFGAGTGVLSAPLAQLVQQVTALDTSAAMLEKLDSKGIANISSLNQDIFHGLPTQYHGVVSSMALHHVADIPALLTSLHDCLLPNGQIALIDLYAEDGSFHGDNKGKGVKHLGFVPGHLLTHATEAGFVDVQLREFFHIQHRNGNSYPLFLLQARKSDQ